MKIYFAASIRGGRDDQEIYRQIVELLRRYGTVLTEHFADNKLSAVSGTGKDVARIYRQDSNWITEADVVVAEVTQPSLGVGFEICYAAVCLNKPVLCLYRPQEGRSLSAMIAGCDRVTNRTYSGVESISAIFDAFFSQKA